LIPTAGKTGKTRRKLGKLSDVIIVKTQFLKSAWKRRKSSQIISYAY
jgi:hypothetical protein